MEKMEHLASDSAQMAGQKSVSRCKTANYWTEPGGCCSTHDPVHPCK